MFTTAMENEENQKRGMVFIYYALGPMNVGMDRTAAWRITMVMQTMPLRPVSLHICYENPVLRPIFDLVMAVTERRNRMRVRAHLGKQQEVTCSNHVVSL